MKTRMFRLEFGINCLADIRCLYKAWDRFWTLEGGVKYPATLCAPKKLIDAGRQKYILSKGDSLNLVFLLLKTSNFTS